MLQPFRSLASANAGETLAIRSFRSREVARLCEQLGMRAGDAVQCRANKRACLILHTAAGRVVSLDQDWARHVQVEGVVLERTEQGDVRNGETEFPVTNR
jgi:hypothetical protein